MKRLLFLVFLFSSFGFATTICDTCEGELVRIESDAVGYHYTDDEFKALWPLVDSCTLTAKSVGLAGDYVFRFYDVTCVDPDDDNGTEPIDDGGDDDNGTEPIDDGGDDDNGTEPIDDGDEDGGDGEDNCTEPDEPFPAKLKDYIYSTEKEGLGLCSTGETESAYLECMPYYRCKRPVTEEDKDCGSSKIWSDELTKCVCKGKDVVEIDEICTLICTPNSHPISTEECECDNGYERDSDGVKCVSTDKPEECPPNSSKDMFGLECKCDDGYIRGADNRCTELDCPEHSNPDIFDNSVCKCEYGYVKSEDGSECFQDNGCVKNAKVNFSTGNCECEEGFEQSSSNDKLSCIKSDEDEEEKDDNNSTVSGEEDGEENEDDDADEENDEESDDEEDGGSGTDDDDIGFGELGEKIGDIAGGIESSLTGSLTALGEDAPTFSCSGTCFYVADLTSYGFKKPIKFDFCFNVRNETKIVWLLILAFLNFKMYLFIIRDLLKKL